MTTALKTNEIANDLRQVLSRLNPKSKCDLLVRVHCETAEEARELTKDYPEAIDYAIGGETSAIRFSECVVVFTPEISNNEDRPKFQYRNNPDQILAEIERLNLDEFLNNVDPKTTVSATLCFHSCNFGLLKGAFDGANFQYTHYEGVTWFAGTVGKVEIILYV